MQEAVFTTPKMTTKNVWIASYGGHYDAIVIFSKKPVYSKVKNRNTDGMRYIEVLDNMDIFIASLSMGDVEIWFPNLDLSEISGEGGRPLAIECTKCMRVKLTAPFDKYGRLKGLDSRMDY